MYGNKWAWIRLALGWFFYNSLFISSTLYPTYSNIDRGNLVLRHSVPMYRRFFRGIASWVAQLNAGVLPWRQSEEMKILRHNNLFLRMGIEPTTVALTVTPSCSCATLASIFYNSVDLTFNMLNIINLFCVDFKIIYSNVLFRCFIHKCITFLYVIVRLLDYIN